MPSPGLMLTAGPRTTTGPTSPHGTDGESMDYRLLGRTGLHVSALGLGTYNFDTKTDHADATRIFEVALEAGCNLIDTANSYGRGASESMLGVLLASCRDEVVLCTKVYNRIGHGPNDQGSSALAIRREVERSLRRLNTDRIDVYFLHRHDPDVPLGDVITTLDRLVAAGKILYYGFSTFPTSRALALDPDVGVVRSWKLLEGVAFADQHGMTRVACEQLPYNLIEREVESHLLPLCRETGTGAIGYSPLAMGALTETSADGRRQVRFDSWFESEAPEWAPMLNARTRLRDLARDAGLKLEDLAIAWASRREGGLASVLTGPRTVEHARRAFEQPKLERDLIEAVDKIVPPAQSLWMRPSEAIYRRHALESRAVQS
jgi:1-deoxyxylulose-5-phosphate synthase